MSANPFSSQQSRMSSFDSTVNGMMSQASKAKEGASKAAARELHDLHNRYMQQKRAVLECTARLNASYRKAEADIQELETLKARFRAKDASIASRQREVKTLLGSDKGSWRGKSRDDADRSLDEMQRAMGRYRHSYIDANVSAIDARIAQLRQRMASYKQEIDKAMGPLDDTLALMRAASSKLKG